MTLSNLLAVITGAVAVVSVVVTTVRVDNLSDENARLRRDLQTQTQARNTAEWLLHDQEQVMQVFSAIRAANRAARTEDETRRNEAKQKITAAVAEEGCADGLVPSSAADELQRIESHARAASGFITGN